ncbi:hypothetical protein ACROYT_G018520 [Oculina patagonica]
MPRKGVNNNAPFNPHKVTKEIPLDKHDEQTYSRMKTFTCSNAPMYLQNYISKRLSTLPPASSNDLQCAPWDIAFVFDDLNDVLNTMETMLNDVLDRHMPLKSKRVKKPNQPAWMTKEILSSMETRDKLLKTARISNLPADWERYRHAKGKTTSLIKKTKRSFFRKKIDENKGNPKGVWQALKTLSGTSKPRVRIDELNTGNNIVSDEASIANELNQYFVNILDQIGKENDAGVEFDDTKLKNFVSSRLNDNVAFNIPPITPKQIIDTIGKIACDKASGHDGISIRVLKIIAPAFASPLCKLLNLSNIDKQFSRPLESSKSYTIAQGRRTKRYQQLSPDISFTCLFEDYRKTRSQLSS